MVDDLLKIGKWLIEYMVALWNFLGTAGFLGFAVIGIFVIKKVCGLFRSVLSIKS